MYKVNLVTLEPPAPAKPKVKPVRIKKPAPKPVKSRKIKKAPPISKKKIAVKKKAAGLKVKKKGVKKKEVAIPANPDDVISKFKQKYGEEIKLENKLDELRTAIASEEKNKESRINNIALQARRSASSSKSGLTKVRSREMDRILKGYYNSLWDKIRKSWVLPGKPESYRGMKAIISVKISGPGELLDVTIEEGSGNSFYDESAVRAVRKAAPFPKLPESQNNGMEIGFRFIPE